MYGREHRIQNSQAVAHFGICCNLRRRGGVLRSTMLQRDVFHPRRSRRSKSTKTQHLFLGVTLRLVPSGLACSSLYKGTREMQRYEIVSGHGVVNRELHTAPYALQLMLPLLASELHLCHSEVERTSLASFNALLDCR